MQISGNVRFQYKHVLKLGNETIDPYIDPKYRFENTQFEKPRHLEKPLECRRIVDDATLTFDCNRREFRSIQKLDLSNSSVTEAGIEALSGAEHATGLQVIDLSKNSDNLQDVALKIISVSPYLIYLEYLILNDCTLISNYTLMSLFSPFSAQVKLQDLTSKQSSNRNMASFVTQQSEVQSTISRSERIIFEKLPKFTKLSLAGLTKINDDGLECITNSKQKMLTYLDIQFTNISEMVACSNIRYLNLSDQNIKDEALYAYCESPYCTHLETLIMVNCPISAYSLKYLSESENTRSLRYLDFSTTMRTTQMSDDAIVYLADAKYLRLRTLKISGHPFTAFRIMQMLEKNLRYIEELHIGSNMNIGDDPIVETLFKLEHLVKVNVSKTAMTAKGITKLQTHKIDVHHNRSDMPAFLNMMEQHTQGVKVKVCDLCITEYQSLLETNLHVLCSKCKQMDTKTREYVMKLCEGCRCDSRVIFMLLMRFGRQEVLVFLMSKENIEIKQMKSKNIDDDRETQVTQQSSKYSTLDDPEVQAQNKEVYKVFGRETAIGKELFGLFNAYDKPKIAYPKVKQKTQEQLQAEKTKQAKGCPQKTQIQYPTQEVRQEPTIHPVDLIKKRKPEAEIRKEIEEYYAGQKFFRPLKRGVDRQKLIEALQQIFKHKRGALPKGAELPEVDVKEAYLDDNETRTNAIKRTHKKYIFSVKDDEEDRFAQLEADPLTELEVLFSEIVKEIQERQEFLDEIQPLDEPKLKQKIKDEIIERVSELQKVQELKKHYKQ